MQQNDVGTKLGCAQVTLPYTVTLKGIWKQGNQQGQYFKLNIQKELHLLYERVILYIDLFTLLSRTFCVGLQKGVQKMVELLIKGVSLRCDRSKLEGNLEVISGQVFYLAGKVNEAP